MHRSAGFRGLRSAIFLLGKSRALAYTSPTFSTPNNKDGDHGIYRS